MQRNQPFHQREAESRSFELPRIVVLDLHKGLAKLREVVRANADAIVAHPEMQPGPKTLGADRHLAALGRELDGIGNEIDQNLLDAAPVAVNFADIVTDVRL